MRTKTYNFSWCMASFDQQCNIESSSRDKAIAIFEKEVLKGRKIDDRYGIYILEDSYRKEYIKRNYKIHFNENGPIVDLSKKETISFKHKGITYKINDIVNVSWNEKTTVRILNFIDKHDFTTDHEYSGNGIKSVCYFSSLLGKANKKEIEKYKKERLNTFNERKLLKLGELKSIEDEINFLNNIK